MTTSKSWYYDKFDNRHKFNISARYKFNSKVSGYAAWTYHSGNRVTIPTQYTALPILPETGGIAPDYYNTEGFVFEKPNNISLPAYHRLDIGFDFHHVTKHGNTTNTSVQTRARGAFGTSAGE